jgi:hypothetical protein
MPTAARRSSQRPRPSPAHTESSPICGMKSVHVRAWTDPAPASPLDQSHAKNAARTTRWASTSDTTTSLRRSGVIGGSTECWIGLGAALCPIHDTRMTSTGLHGTLPSGRSESWTAATCRRFVYLVPKPEFGNERERRYSGRLRRLCPRKAATSRRSPKGSHAAAVGRPKAR